MTALQVLAYVAPARLAQVSCGAEATLVNSFLGLQLACDALLQLLPLIVSLLQYVRAFLHAPYVFRLAFSMHLHLKQHLLLLVDAIVSSALRD